MSAPAAAAGARAAFASGRSRGLGWRAGQLAALDRLLAENGAEIEGALAADLGRPALEAHLSEVRAVRAELRFARRRLRRWARPRRVGVPAVLRPARGSIDRQPLGTVLIIAPWNYPVNLLLTPLIGALAAGNTAVLKPSELSPHTSALLAQLVPRYLDAEAIRVVEGGVAETTELLAERWDHIFYTGNGRVGRIVLAAAARHLTPVTLELGGKSPVWVDETADLAAAARWIVSGKFLNAGQTCVAPDYLLTTPALQPRLVAELGRHITAMYGEQPRESADLGRIVSSQHLDRLIGLLPAGGAAIGGDWDRDDRYLAPTVLTGVSRDDPVMQQEIFGPILPVLTVRDPAAAIEAIAAGEKPLTISVFSRDRRVRSAFRAGTSSGSIVLNAVGVQLIALKLPFGGVGESGMGAYHGEESLRRFSHERSVLAKGRWPNLAAAAFPPVTAKRERLIRRRG